MTRVTGAARTGVASRLAPHARISLLEAEPDLARRVPPSEVLEARRRSVVPVVLVGTGPWEPPACSARGPADPLGFLVLDGLLARDERLAGSVSTELIGPGDLIQPHTRSREEELVPRSVSWVAFEPSAVAVLDAPFTAAIARWPQILAALVERALRNGRRLSTHQAICQLPRVDDRLLLLFWHLAERWGRVVPGGILLSLPLRHETLGHLVGAKRSSVTVSLGNLCDEGRVQRRADGALVLRGEPPRVREAPAHRSPNGRVARQRAGLTAD